MQIGTRMLISLLLIGLWVTSTEAAAAEAPGDGRRVVAKVNQVEVTYDDFKIRVQLLEQERGPVAPERYGEILRALVREEILYQAAVAQHLEEEAGVKQRAEVARRQVIIEELLRRKLEASSQVSDDEARSAYEQNKLLFSSETVGVSHIMVKTESDAEAVQADLKAGKSFAAELLDHFQGQFFGVDFHFFQTRYGNRSAGWFNVESGMDHGGNRACRGDRYG